MRTSEYAALDKYISSSDEIKAAIIQSCDPFHDWTWSPTGLPDSLTGNSVVRVVKKTFQVENKSSPGAPFDCHIFTLPISYGFGEGGDRTYGTVAPSRTPDFFCSLSEIGNVNIPTFGTPDPKVYPLGPIVIAQCPVGGETFPSTNAFNFTNLIIETLDFNEFMDGNTREISSAFEVHNVTNKLSVSGTCTVYRSPHSFQDCLPMFNNGGAAARRAPCYVCPAPPGRYTEALLLAGSKQWEAEWGTYIVETFDHELNRPQVMDSDSIFFSNSPSYGSYMYGVARAPRLSAAVQGAEQLFPRNKLCPRDISGAYFTGLDKDTQLTITVTKVFETFPSVKDPLVTLARPSQTYSAEFFTLYKEIAARLPPGVMVGENASGDWWRKLVGVIKDAAPLVGSAFGPLGATLGGLVQKGAGAIESWDDARTPVKKEKEKKSGPIPARSLVTPTNSFKNSVKPKPQAKTAQLKKIIPRR